MPRWSRSRFRRRRSVLIMRVIRSWLPVMPSSPSLSSPCSVLAARMSMVARRWKRRAAAGREGRQYPRACGQRRHRRSVAARRRDLSQSLGFHRRRVCVEGQLGTEARRISVPEERQSARCHRHHRRRQGRATLHHDSRGLTSEQIVARLTDSDIFTGSIREMPREGTLLPGDLQIPPWHAARPGDPAHAAIAEARAGRSLGTP